MSSTTTTTSGVQACATSFSAAAQTNVTLPNILSCIWQGHVTAAQTVVDGIPEVRESPNNDNSDDDESDSSDDVLERV